MRPSPTGTGVRLRRVLVALLGMTWLALSAGCSHPAGTMSDIPPCPPGSVLAELEGMDACGSQLGYCPAYREWILELDSYCQEIEAMAGRE